MSENCENPQVQDPEAYSEDENEEFSAVDAHQDALEEIMAKIDETQETVDALQDQITDTRIEISHLNNEISRLKKLKQKQTIECVTLNPTNTDFDVKLLNPEHKAYFNEIENRVNETEMRVENVERINQNIEEDVDNLIRENDEIEKQIKENKRRFEQAQREKTAARAKLELTRRELAETEAAIRSNTSSLKYAENAIAGLIARRDGIDGHNSVEVELSRDIENLQSMISQEIEYQAQLNQDNDEFLSNGEQECSELIVQIDQIRNMILWKDEKANIQAEIQSTKQQTKELKENNSQLDRKYKHLFQRFQALRPIAKKHLTNIGSIEMSDQAKESTIDQLIDELSKKSGNQEMQKSTNSQELSAQAIVVSHMEATIAKKKEEFERNLFLFKVEEKRLKNMIDERRKTAFDEEHEVVSQINLLNMKLAQKLIKC